MLYFPPPTSTALGGSSRPFFALLCQSLCACASLHLGLLGGSSGSGWALWALWTRGTSTLGGDPSSRRVKVVEEVKQQKSCGRVKQQRDCLAVSDNCSTSLSPWFTDSSISGTTFDPSSVEQLGLSIYGTTEEPLTAGQAS
ncbi:hypothetical protein THAOC_31876 [Thalassiosira oceanica]|uniref:Uncharacterized protein n=1 Tax=Thalassiosira oceanica TaxID=159749 RepID=K0R8D9_THAOC|nr:hypothetical protein THAOC_31876 [Thalassiosira oceanica]|eukprot:EJK49270.1 hypothetical protein THAOC_31876 [Thalassiosira oceanica]